MPYKASMTFPDGTGPPSGIFEKEADAQAFVDEFVSEVGREMALLEAVGKAPVFSISVTDEDVNTEWDERAQTWRVK